MRVWSASAYRLDRKKIGQHGHVKTGFSASGNFYAKRRDRFALPEKPACLCLFARVAALAFGGWLWAFVRRAWVKWQRVQGVRVGGRLCASAGSAGVPAKIQESVSLRGEDSRSPVPGPGACCQTCQPCQPLRAAEYMGRGYIAVSIQMRTCQIGRMPLKTKRNRKNGRRGLVTR
jgi:hypothetical protein